MKIAIFTDTFYPEINGVATSCLNLQKELLSRGHEAHVYAPKCKGYKKYENEYTHYITSVPLFLLKDRNLALTFSIDIDEIAELGFDVVHTNSEFFMGYMGKRVSKKCHCERVHTYHTIWEDYTYYLTHGYGDEYVSKIIRKYSEWFCEKFGRVIVPSKKTKDLLMKYNVDTPIDIIPTGIDLSKFTDYKLTDEERKEIREECGVLENEKVLLYIGRIAKEKNIETIINALPAYFNKDQNVRFVLIGEGPDSDNLKQLTKDLNIEDRVNFVGPKKWEIIEKYYQIGDVFISASNSETQGLTYIEALASNLIVVAKDDPCLDGVIINNQSGYIFEDEASLIEALDKAFNSSEHIKEFNQEFIKEFSVKRFVDRVLETYNKAILHE